MERNFVQSETIINEHPPYACLWIPKAHWLLHMAHDIFLYGPTRLLATYLNEMKNAKFKAGAKRGNFHNPAKDVAVFWAGQSNWELRSMPVSRNICCSESATVLVSGVASQFAECLSVSILLQHTHVTSSHVIEFLSDVQFHGVLIRKDDHVLVQQAVYLVERVIREGQHHFLMLSLHAREVMVDRLGAYYVPSHATQWMSDSIKMLSLIPTSDVTGLWTFCVEDMLYVIPKY